MLFIAALTAQSAIGSDFRFDRDTFAFANETVFENRDGLAHLQERMHANVDAALARGGLFVAHLSTFPNLSINHAVLVYARKSVAPAAIERYAVYDPNHPEAPRELTWSPTDRAFAYQKDWDFVGGFVRVYQVYGKPIQ